MPNCILLIFLISGGHLAGKGDDVSGIVFFSLGTLILVIAIIKWKLHLKEEQKKKAQRENKNKLTVQ